MIPEAYRKKTQCKSQLVLVKNFLIFVLLPPSLDNTNHPPPRRFPRAAHTACMEGSAAQSRAAPQLQQEPTQGPEIAAPSAPSRCSILGQRQDNLQPLPPRCHAPCASGAAGSRRHLPSDGAQPADARFSYQQLFAVGMRWRVWIRDVGLPAHLGDALLPNRSHGASPGSSRVVTRGGGRMEMPRRSLPTRFPLPSKKEE